MDSQEYQQPVITNPESRSSEDLSPPSEPEQHKGLQCGNKPQKISFGNEDYENQCLDQSLASEIKGTEWSGERKASYAEEKCEKVQVFEPEKVPDNVSGSDTKIQQEFLQQKQEKKQAMSSLIISENSSFKNISPTPPTYQNIDQEKTMEPVITALNSIPPIPENSLKNQQSNRAGKQESPDSQITLFLEKLCEKYQIDQEDREEVVKQFKQGNIDECVENAKKKYRKDMKTDIQNFLQALKGQKQSKKEEQKMQPQSLSMTEEQFAKILSGKYQIDQDDQADLLRQLKVRNLNECLSYTKKKYRDQLKKQIQEYWSQKDNQTGKEASPKPEKELDKQLMSLLEKFGVDQDDVQECMKLVKGGQVQQSILFVTKKKRQEFMTNVKKLSALYQRLEKSATSQQDIMKPKQKGETSLLQYLSHTPSQMPMILTLKVGKILKQLKVNSSTQLQSILVEKYDIDEQQYSKIFDGQQINNLDSIFQSGKEQGLLKLVKKLEIKCQFNDMSVNTWLAEEAAGEEVKRQVLAEFKKNNISIIGSNNILLSYQTEKGRYEGLDNLKKIASINGTISKILVERTISVSVYYQDSEKMYKMRSLNTVADLKKSIQQDFLPKEAQSLQYELNGTKTPIKQQEQQCLLTKFIENEKDFLQLLLTNAYTTEFYGFHSNWKQNFNQFSEFNVGDEKELIQVIQNCDFSHNNEEQVFFDNFIIYLYGCMKKRFPMQSVIEKMKELVVKNKFETVWVPRQDSKPRKMNETFLLMYLLRNSDQRLRIQIMNLVKNLMPLPLYINYFQSIFDRKSVLELNKQIIWVLKKGITICSIGLSNGLPVKQKGKSSLLNQIFFTNFCLNESKHKVVCQIPYIAIRVYEDLFPLNIIDVPQDCSEQIMQKMLDCSDIVLLHSWKSEKQTQEYCRSIQKKFQIQCFALQRDSKQISRDNLKALNESNLQKNKVLKVPDLTNFQANKGSIDIIRQKFNLMLASLKNKLKNSKKIFDILESEQFEAFDRIVDRFENKNLEICQFGRHIALFDKQRSEVQEILVQDLRKKQLNEVIIKLLKFISKSQLPQDMLLMYFRHKLRNIQNQSINKFLVIYKIKEKLEKFDKTKHQEYKKQIEASDKIIRELYEVNNNPSRSLIGKTSEEVSTILDGITSDFENNIKPKVFSIQLFWREIYAFNKLKPHSPIQKTNLTDLIIDLKAKQIMNNQPFEIIDGDCLEMPKDIMKKVFGGIQDNCLVLTIIGPQSSGKSTLLNFLFGCDFATSEGRCTRGVYGTYFRLNDPRITSFEGVFVIDTEGLFALTNETDSKHQDRENFDSKLVLFCLAVSDIVIINVRGNLDINTERMLSICHEKLGALNLSQDQKPQIVIVLNQNSTSKTEESQNEFKKIRKTLSFNISKSLPLAYSIKNYAKNQICLLAENEILTKKTPFPQFYNETTSLLNQIVQKMKRKKTAQKIVTKIEKFAQIWSTVLSFPNLSQMTTKQYRELQTEIKTWKKQRDEQLNYVFRQIISQYKNEEIDEKSATNRIQKINTEYLEAFQKQYQKQALNQQLRLLVETEKKQILLKNENNFMKLKYHIMETNMQKELNRQKFQGDGILREMEKQIIKNQNNKTKQYTDRQKEQIFEKGFNQALEKIKKTMKLNEQHNAEYQRIKNEYQLLIKTNRSQIKECGLPKQNINFSNKDIVQYSKPDVQDKLMNRFMNQTIKESSSFMVYTERPYTNILSGSISDAKLKYFNMKDYFQKESQVTKYYLSVQDIARNFNFDKFVLQLKYARKKFKSQSGSQQKLKEIYNEINNYLQQSFGFRMAFFDNFNEIYDSKTCGRFKGFLNRLFSSQQELNLVYLDRYSGYESGRRGENGTYHYGFNRNITKYSKYLTLSTKDVYNEATIGEEMKQQRLKTLTLPKIVRDRIQWNEIRKAIQQSQKNNQMIKNMKLATKRRTNQYLRDEINKDLNKLNIFLPCQVNIIDIFESDTNKTIQRKNNDNQRSHNQRLQYVEQQKESINDICLAILNKIRVIDDNRIVKEEMDIKYQLSGLKYFQCKKLEEQLKVDTHYTYNLLCIAKYQYEVLKPKQDYFKDYQQSKKQMKKRFKDKKFQQFIFNEIRNKKGSLALFFKQVCRIVKQMHVKWGKFDSKAITSVFSLINEQISQFNNDLNQISHELHPVIVGETHLIAIYLMWKYELDEIVKKQNEPYLKKLNSRDAELKRFMMRTSNQLNDIVGDEVEEFLQELASEFSNYIDDRKSNQIFQTKKQFNLNVNREKIQQQIDMMIFSRHTNPEIVLQYLEKPSEIIQSRYEQNYADKWDELVREFKKNRYSDEILKEFEDILQQMKSTLENVDKISEEKGNPRDLFEMVNKDSEQSDYDEEAKKILFSYFLDKILNNDEDKQRICLDIKLKPRATLTKTTFAKGLLRKLLQNIKIDQLKITNLVKFISLILRKECLEKYRQKLQKIFSFTEEERKTFISQIRVVVCKEKCPCCARICGIQESHSFHQCRYGHQMRALAGNYISRNGKKQAYVVRCQMLKETDLMEYNGNSYTWTAFKDYWANKPTGGWLYDDLKNKLDQVDRKRFENAWIIAGPLFCQSKGIEYVDYNDADRQQNQKKMMGKTHFIFALDESGSMSGSSWNDLIRALDQIMVKIDDHNKKGGQAYVTIINFAGSARIIYSRAKPSQIKARNIPFSSGWSTNFQAAFSQAHQVANNYIHQQAIVFIFMTDGGATYPQNSIKSLQGLMINNPKKFTYSGIEFGSNQKVMTLISNSLKGKNIRASNFEQLLKAYTQCVEIIAFKEESGVINMKE